MAKNVNPVLKALSVAQPWAECIVAKGKNIENRSWNTKFRGYFAIHSSASADLDRFERCEEVYGISLDPDNVALGSIVGFAELVNVVTESDLTPKNKKWFMGDYGFVLANVIRLKKPVKAKGSLSFWVVPPSVARACLAQLTSAERKKVLGNPIRKDESVKKTAAPRKIRKKIVKIGGLKIYVDPKFKGF